MPNDNNHLGASETDQASPVQNSRILQNLLSNRRLGIQVVLGSLIVILLAANLLTRGDSPSNSSGVIFSSPSTSAVQSPAVSLVNQAVELITNKEYESALTVLNEAITADPNYGLAYYNQGVALQFSAKNTEAITSYTKALTFNNKDASSYYNRGLAHRDVGNLKDAESDLRIASVMKPEWAAAKFNLGQVLVSLGKTSDGEKLIADAKAIDPNIGK